MILVEKILLINERPGFHGLVRVHEHEHVYLTKLNHLFADAYDTTLQRIPSLSECCE